MKNNRQIRVASQVLYRQISVDIKDHLWTFAGAFLGIGLIGLINQYLNGFSATENVMLIGSFGASAVLLYGSPKSPLAQTRNLIGGHLISAVTGVACYKTVLVYGPGSLWFSAAVSVAASIVLMQITQTLHPPGGATALIANIGTIKIQSLGYLYVLSPVLTGVVVLFLVATLVNRLRYGKWLSLPKWFSDD